MGRVFAIDTVVDNVSLLLRTVILQTIYTKTVDWWQVKMFDSLKFLKGIMRFN